jgi:hypothetical protein
LKNNSIKNRSGATIILAIGISTLLLLFAIGIGKVVQNSSRSIRDFKNKWQAGLVADSIKEQLMLQSKGEGAGYNMEEGNCGNDIQGVGTLVGNIDNKLYKKEEIASEPVDGLPPGEYPTAPNPAGVPGTVPPLLDSNGNTISSSGSIKFKCSVQGTNDVAIENDGANSPITCNNTDANKCYTIPTANTGNAGIECNDKYPVTDVASLEQWVSMMFPKEIATDLSNAFFEKDPLRHPCNWGRLKFGSDAGKRVVVPLYYKEGTTTYQLGSNSNGVQDQLYIRVRTPCKPIKDRQPSAKTAAGDIVLLSGDKCSAHPNNPECKYRDICSDGNRYELDTTTQALPCGTSCTQMEKDKTLLVWQISGECEVESSTPGEKQKQPCALIHNQDQETGGLVRAGQNSEITESKINNYNILTDIIKMDGAENSYGTLTGKKVPDNTSCRDYTNQPAINEFLTPSSYSPICDEFSPYIYSLISNPTLQLAITEPEIKDDDTPKNRVPYLEYQIITNKKIANPLEIYNVDVNFLGQNFKLQEVIEQVKNVIDFAVQN